ncbi:MAG: carboxypeptidase-like regulatory domain-containing protein [Bacteroidales bacterium]|nr:carboxypeptidase-like regulatory domain-containing protein [Bacteroidales bacterium]
MKYLFTFLTTILIAIGAAQAQTKVRGTVTDGETGEPLPFVSIVFTGTTTGTITDIDGNFFLQGHVNSDTLEFSMMGYTPYFYKVQRDAYQEINVVMDPDSYELNEIVVHPGENPAWRIMRNVAANRKKNDPDRLDSYKFEVYNKMEVDINNIREDFTDRAILRNFSFIMNYADTSAETGKVYLPVMISETLSEISHSKNPSRKKEVIKASKISGVENESVSQYTGQMYLEANIYKNYIPAFGHEFVSPVSDLWKANYKFYLLDSAYQEGHYLYHISFRPKHKQTYTFSGDMWIADTTWAVKKVQAKMATDVNINYINNYIITQEYDMVDSAWFLIKEEMFMDINFTDSTMGFFGRKTMSRRNVEINPIFGNNDFSQVAAEETIVEDGANQKDESYWAQSRHEQLNEKERNIYQMVDSIKEVPAFKTITNTVEMFISGYYPVGWWEIGPYFSFLSHNEIEGWRVRFGGQTNANFSPKIRLSAYGAYGFKDEKFKYGAGVLYLFNKSPRRSVSVNAKHDYEKLGQSINALSEDNIMSTILARTKNIHLLLVDEYKAEYEHEFFNGFSNSIGAQYRNITPSKYIPFRNASLDYDYKQLTSYEAYYKLHFCYNEKFVTGDFKRVSMGSGGYPAFDLELTAGTWDDRGNYKKYYRIIGMISQKVSLGPLGKTRYIIEGGKVFGTVPFPLLKLHEGNETYAFDKYAFNMMNLYEFASDTYASATVEHHFNGFIFNRLPLLRKLKWREIVYGKGLIGDISSRNCRKNAIMDFPSSLGDVNKPYFEAGVGIENIFRFFRVDGVWRLTHLDNPGVSKFAVLLKMQVIL